MQSVSISPSGLNVLPQDISYSLYVSKNKDIQTIIEPIRINDFPNAENTRDLKQEFNLLQKLTDNPNFEKIKIPYNPVIFKHHRYSDIVPYKHSNVILKDKSSNSPEESYVCYIYIHI